MSNGKPQDLDESIDELLTSLTFNDGRLNGLKGRPGIEEHLNVRALSIAITHLETAILWVKEARK